MMRRVVRSAILAVPALTCCGAPSVPVAQQRMENSPCGIQIGDGARNTSVTLHCYPQSADRDRPTVTPFGGGADEPPPIVVELAAPDLARGTRRFELVVANRSPTNVITASLSDLSIADDLGTLYGVDLFGLWRENQGRFPHMGVAIPPGSRARFPVLLDRPVDRAASAMFLTLRNVWYTPRGDAFSYPLGTLEWSATLETGASAANGATDGADERDIRAVQAELGRLGHYTSPVDGDWGRGSERALRAFQRAIGEPPTGRLSDGIRLLDAMRDR